MGIIQGLEFNRVSPRSAPGALLPLLQPPHFSFFHPRRRLDRSSSMMAATVALSHGRRRSVGSPTAAAGLAVTIRDGELGRLSCGHRRFGHHPPRRRARPALLRPPQEARPSLSAAASAVSSSASGARSSSDGASFVGSADGVRPTSPRPPREVSYFFCLWFLYFFFSSIILFLSPHGTLRLPRLRYLGPQRVRRSLRSSSRPIPRRWGSPNGPSRDDALR